MERLQKILAHAGVASRRKCEQLILDGKVEVNGSIVTELGSKVDPNEDVIKVNGQAITKEKPIYIALYKPKGVITSLHDPQGRKVITEYLKGIEQRIYPVGRLDYDTEGLLLVTNDGELANKLMHPKHHIPKTYLVTVKGIPHGSILEKLRNGVKLEDGWTSPAEVEYADVDPEGKKSVISITIYEGKNRQVRRMFDAVNFRVVRLKRIQFGTIQLTGLARGRYRYLTAEEIEELTEGIIDGHTNFIKGKRDL